MGRGWNGYSLWCLVFFCSFVNRLIEFYPEIFDSESGDSSHHQINFSKKWAAYTTIYELAEGDILKYEKVTQEPLEKCLLYLCYKADKVQLENIMHKEALKRVS